MRVVRKKFSQNVFRTAVRGRALHGGEIKWANAFGSQQKSLSCGDV